MFINFNPAATARSGRLPAKNARCDSRLGDSERAVRVRSDRKRQDRQPGGLEQVLAHYRQIGLPRCARRHRLGLQLAELPDADQARLHQARHATDPRRASAMRTNRASRRSSWKWRKTSACRRWSKEWKKTANGNGPPTTAPISRKAIYSPAPPPFPRSPDSSRPYRHSTECCSERTPCRKQLNLLQGADDFCDPFSVAPAFMPGDVGQNTHVFSPLQRAYRPRGFSHRAHC